MCAGERCPAFSERCAFFIVEFVQFRNRMVEERFTYEVVFFTVVAPDEDDGERPDRSLVISGLETAGFLVNEGERGVVPSPEMLEETEQLFVGKVRQNSSNTDLSWVFGITQVVTVSKIMLVDNRTTVHTFRSQHQFKRFTNRRFADVVPANQQRVPLEDDTPCRNATKVFDLEYSHTHSATPPFHSQQTAPPVPAPTRSLLPRHPVGSHSGQASGEPWTALPHELSP